MQVATVLPAMFTTPWLWPILAALLVGLGLTDRRVRQHQGLPPDAANGVMLAALAVAAGMSVAAGATFPAGASVAWPLLGFAVMAAMLVLRFSATSALGGDFNAALLVRPGQLVVSGGPYRWVRHPGYMAVAGFFAGMTVAYAFWPPVVVAVVLQGASFRARISQEEDQPPRDRGLQGVHTSCALADDPRLVVNVQIAHRAPQSDRRLPASFSEARSHLRPSWEAGVLRSEAG